MDQAPDVIMLTASHEEELAADRADLLVRVQGSSLVTGRAALDKAAEVRALVEELERCRIPREAVALESVHAQVSTGILGKSSSAVYRLRIRVDVLELLPDALGAVTGAKNAELEHVVWRYPETAERQAAWLQACVATTNAKAAAAAGALGVRLVGVHRLSEEPIQEVERFVGAPMAMMEGDHVRRSRQVELGFELGQKKRCGVRVTVAYRVEGFTRTG